MSFHYKNKRHNLLILHYCIFILFLYSAISKSMDFELFVNNLYKSPFFSNLNPKLLAIVVIAIEFFIPAVLFFDSTSKIGYLSSFFLLFVFTGYILMMFWLSPYLPCSCGGLIEALSWEQHVYFNILFMIFSFTLFNNANKQDSTL